MLVLEAIGNLGADAIIKDLNGQKYIAFSVAHTESYKDSQGQRHERTTWVSCLKYGESQVINYLKKGTRVFIRGELSAKAYEAGGALHFRRKPGGPNRSPPAGRNDFGRYTNLRAAGISATRRSRRFAILTIIDMIGKKLSPVLEEMEATLWEYEAFNGAKPNYTLQKLIKILSMKAKQFKEVNAVYGENQPEYYPLPAYKSEDGTAVFCFELDEEERKKIAETGELWVALRTFNQPLQPICVTVNKSDVLITQ